MSSRCSVIAAGFFANAAFAGAYAQEEAVTAEALIEQQRHDVESLLETPEDCAPDAMQPDVIVVCRDITEAEEQTREAMSVLPKPVQSDRRVFYGIADPPCWISNPGGACIRGGWAPPPIYLIDLDAIPEALSEEEAALVYRYEDLPAEAASVLTEDSAEETAGESVD